MYSLKIVCNYELVYNETFQSIFFSIEKQQKTIFQFKIDVM